MNSSWSSAKSLAGQRSTDAYWPRFNNSEISNSGFKLVLPKINYRKICLTLKLLSLSDAIKYGSVHLTKRVPVLHVLTHDASTAQTIFATCDAFGAPSVVRGAKVGKMSGAGILRDARYSCPRRALTIVVVVLCCILNNWNSLAFNPLMDQMLPAHVGRCLFWLLIWSLALMLFNRLLNRWTFYDGSDQGLRIIVILLVLL